MYLKGYQIKYEKEQIITLPKWDFGGDRSHTNRIWNDILSRLRSLPENSYPFLIMDLDKEESSVISIKGKEEFENWLSNDFAKRG